MVFHIVILQQEFNETLNVTNTHIDADYILLGFETSNLILSEIKYIK